MLNLVTLLMTILIAIFNKLILFKITRRILKLIFYKKIINLYFFLKKNDEIKNKN